MRTRRFLWTVAALAAVNVAGVVVLWPEPTGTDRICPRNFERIDADMTRAEAEALLGPPDDYRTAPPATGTTAPEPPTLYNHVRVFNDIEWRIVAEKRPFVRNPGHSSVCDWRTDTTHVRVVFGRDGRAVLASCYEVEGRRDLVGDFVRWVKRQWQQLSA